MCIKAYQKNIFFDFYFGELRLVCGWEFLNIEKKRNWIPFTGSVFEMAFLKWPSPILGQNIFFFKYSLHYTQKKRLWLTISTQSTEIKSDHPVPRNKQKRSKFWLSKPNRQILSMFCSFLCTGWSDLISVDCVETVSQRRFL